MASQNFSRKKNTVRTCRAEQMTNIFEKLTKLRLVPPGPKNRNHSIKWVKSKGYDRWLICKQPRRDLGLRGFSFALYSVKCFTQSVELCMETQKETELSCHWVLLYIETRSYYSRAPTHWNYDFFKCKSFWANSLIFWLIREPSLPPFYWHTTSKLWNSNVLYNKMRNPL